MHLHDIIFKLNETEKLVIDLERPFEKLPCYCQITIAYYEEGPTEYIVTLDDDLESSMSRFSNALAKALKNELRLHESINKDIGYLLNEYLKYALNDNDDEWQLHPDLVYEDNNFSWIGFQYQIWSCRQWAAWIYNDAHGEIVFEITPRYTGFFVGEGELVLMPSYEEWMTLYKAAVVRVVPKNIASQWLEQAFKILVHIKESFDKGNADSDDDKKLIYEDCPRQ